jgi:hypothetical protein
LTRLTNGLTVLMQLCSLGSSSHFVFIAIGVMGEKSIKLYSQRWHYILCWWAWAIFSNCFSKARQIGTINISCTMSSLPFTRLYFCFSSQICFPLDWLLNAFRLRKKWVGIKNELIKERKNCLCMWILSSFWAFILFFPLFWETIQCSR